MEIMNGKIIKIINAIAGYNDDIIGSIKLGRKITFHLNTFIMYSENGHQIFRSHIEMTYFQYFFRTMYLWIKRIFAKLF